MNMEVALDTYKMYEYLFAIVILLKQFSAWLHYFSLSVGLGP